MCSFHACGAGYLLALRLVFYSSQVAFSLSSRRFRSIVLIRSACSQLYFGKTAGRFADRSSLLDYQGKPQFEAVIRRARSRIEQYTEERLFDRDGSAGARFSLQNNFKGWRDNRDVSITAAEGTDIMAEVRAKMAEEAQVVARDI